MLIAATCMVAPHTANAAKKKGMLTVSAAGRAIGGSYAPFTVDTTGAKTSGEPEVSTRMSLLATLQSGDSGGKLRFEGALGLDVARGTLMGKETLAGDQMPATTFDGFLPTDGWVGIRYGKGFVARAGLMTSNWGLGLLANDGKSYMDGRNRDWFVRSETGDRVLRALVLARPFADSSSTLRGLILSAAMDRVVADDVLMRKTNKATNLLDLNEEEVAMQGIFAARLFVTKQTWFGLYYVYRDQQHSDGKWLKVHAVDLAAHVSSSVAGNPLLLRGEAVMITGDTNLSASPEFPEHTVKQAAIAGQARLDIGQMRVELDGAWLSGDNNFDDGNLTQFKADRNYQLGLLLFPRVLGAWSGRSRLTASNPDVVGYPNEDLERLGTGGAVTSTMAIFPKIGYAMPFGLDIYGGALFAFAPTAVADPFHSKTSGGGEARNAMNEPQGAQLGIELDIGIRYTLKTPMNSGVTIGAEYGFLMPGSALKGLTENVHGGRLTLSFAPDYRTSK